MIEKGSTVLVTGGAGYVGAVLVPRLIAEGYRVKVLDLFIFGDVLEDNSRLEKIKGDIRDRSLLETIIPGCDALIHLACISNDPCFELNPELSKSINYDCFEPLVSIAKKSGVERFIYASTSSVYGISDAEEVAEDHPLLPITDYNKYKGMCEPILHRYESNDFTTVVIRPATVCGYSPRQRLDLTVNILTNHAINNGVISIFGGEQKRPNIHIEDMVDLYILLLNLPKQKVSGQTFNAGYQNHKVSEIASIVKDTVSRVLPDKSDIKMVTLPSEDTRSYHICSDKIKNSLGFVPARTIENAVEDLIDAFQSGKLPNSMEEPIYFNIKAMQLCKLS